MLNHTVFILGAIFCIQCTQQPTPDISYRVSKIEGNQPKLVVELSFAADPSGTAIVNYPNNAWGQQNLHQGITDIALVDSAGEIEQHKDSGWFAIKHPKDLDSIRIRYALQQDFEFISSRETYRPIIQPEYFHVFSHNLFMVPKLGKDTVDISLNWDDFSEATLIHNSFGSKQRRQILRDMPLQLFGSAIFVGGDFRVYEDEIEGNKISLATRGDWIPFEEDSVMHVLKQTLQAQRAFWKDHSQEYFTVTMQPFTQEQGSSMQGTGLTNSFATSVSNNEFMNLELLIYLFNHELMHNWIGHTIENDNEEEQYWFSEGFTEYYTFKNIAKNRINGLDGSYFINSINETIRNLEGSPVKNAPNKEINYDNYWSNRDFGKLPYYRGSLFAFCLDLVLQQQSNGENSLDDLMRFLLEDTQLKEQKITNDYFLAAANKFFEEDIQPLFDAVIINGGDLPLAEIFEALELSYHAETDLFDMGFELSDDRKTITSVMPGSKAEESGLKTGDQLFSRSIWYGRVDKLIELGVKRNGVEKQISFYPIKKAKVPTLINSAENRASLKL
ncbi:MAG: hypothetical protein ED555_06455 [Allomuricauda sp.]|nr:MAG: hypothetical protein ED555_06455 [Allomuricauda sp.]